MNEDKVLRQQLLNLLQGGNAHITFDQAIEKIPMGLINKKLHNFSYTLWHLLEHIRIAQWDILQFVCNPDHISPPWPEGYWPSENSVADRNTWDKTVEKFHYDFGAIRNLINNPDTNFYSPLPHAKEYTVLREILLVADHNAYHIGQLVTMGKMVKIQTA